MLRVSSYRHMSMVVKSSRILPKSSSSGGGMRSLSSLSALRYAWRPSPMPQGPPQSQNSADPVEEEPVFGRRARVGLLIAFGVTAVNGYVWYSWALANSMAARNDTSLLSYMTQNFTCSRRNYNEGRWWTVVTSGFSHLQFWHFLANTIGVLSFLPTLVGRIGPVSGLATYVGCIVGGSAASLYSSGQWQSTDVAPRSAFHSILSAPRLEKTDTPGLGASAGVLGLFTFTTLLAPTATVSIFFVPFPAWLAWGLLTGVDAYCTFSPEGRRKMAEFTGIQIGHEAHLGGSITALLASLLLMPRFWLRR